MNLRTNSARRWAPALLLSLSLLSGCFAVAVGAGAGAAIAWTQRGASSLVQGSVDEVFERSVAVFDAMDIERTGDSRSEGDRKRTLTGRRGARTVVVEMERESPTTTQTEVYASRSAVEWDRRYARDVLTRIINRN